MKKFDNSSKSLVFTALISFFVLLFALCFAGCAKEIPHSEYIRLHVRADSNEQDAQEVKLKVRDAVVSYLTVKANGVSGREEMKTLILSELDEIEEIADAVLTENGKEYRSKAYLAIEDFPEKSYGDLTLESGEYEALILSLGSGEGDNWWCVAYPPLCFIAAEEGGDGVEYRSLIADFFKNLK